MLPIYSEALGVRSQEKRLKLDAGVLKPFPQSLSRDLRFCGFGSPLAFGSPVGSPLGSPLAGRQKI